MAARSTGSGTISFGLVSIPVKFYTAATAHRLSFHMLHKTCGNRVRMQYFCPYDEEVVPREDTVRGFEHAKDEFVEFTDEELQRLEGERSDRVDIIEFVPEDSVDLVYLEDTRYVGPAKGGERAYKLLADAMARTKRIAIGRYGARGREQLVVLRPYKGGLAMHLVYYADEVRPMEEVEFPRQITFRDAEQDLADQLVNQLSTDVFQPEKYRDDYRARVLQAVEEKVLGNEISTPPEHPKAQVIDLFEALRRSLSEKAPQRPPEAQPAAGEAPRPVKKAAPRRREKTGTGE